MTWWWATGYNQKHRKPGHSGLMNWASLHNHRSVELVISNNLLLYLHQEPAASMQLALRSLFEKREKEEINWQVYNLITKTLEKCSLQFVDQNRGLRARQFALWWLGKVEHTEMLECTQESSAISKSCESKWRLDRKYETDQILHLTESAKTHNANHCVDPQAAGSRALHITLLAQTSGRARASELAPTIEECELQITSDSLSIVTIIGS